MHASVPAYASHPYNFACASLTLKSLTSSCKLAFVGLTASVEDFNRCRKPYNEALQYGGVVVADCLKRGEHWLSLHSRHGAVQWYICINRLSINECMYVCVNIDIDIGYGN